MDNKELIEKYLRDSFHEPNTIKAYGRALEKFAKFVNCNLLDVSMLNCNEYFNMFLTKEEKKVAKQTFNLLLQAVRGFYNHAIEEGLYNGNTNPTRKIKRKVRSINEIKKTEMSFLTRQEVKKYVNTAKEEFEKAKTIRQKKLAFRNYVIVKLMLNTGIRECEVIELLIDDVNFNNSTIFISEDVAKNDNEFYPVMSQEVNDLMLEYFNNYRDNCSCKNFFLDKNNGAIDANSFYVMIKGIGKKAKLNRKVNPHMLRHTFATLSYNIDHDIQRVAGELNQKTVSVTAMYAASESILDKKGHNFV